MITLIQGTIEWTLCCLNKTTNFFCRRWFKMHFIELHAVPGLKELRKVIFGYFFLHMSSIYNTHSVHTVNFFKIFTINFPYLALMGEPLGVLFDLKIWSVFYQYSQSCMQYRYALDRIITVPACIKRLNIYITDILDILDHCPQWAIKPYILYTNQRSTWWLASTGDVDGGYNHKSIIARQPHPGDWHCQHHGATQRTLLTTAASYKR